MTTWRDVVVKPGCELCQWSRLHVWARVSHKQDPEQIVIGIDPANNLPVAFALSHDREWVSTAALARALRGYLASSRLPGLRLPTKVDSFSDDPNPVRSLRINAGGPVYARGRYPGSSDPQPLSWEPDHPAVWWFTTRDDVERELMPQQMADEVTRVAQRYVGYFHRRSMDWAEPLVTADDCILCVRMTDDDVHRRIRGFQKAMEIEISRINRGYTAGTSTDFPDRRQYDDPDAYWEAAERAFDQLRSSPSANSLVFGYRLDRMPFHLQRQLCIEWNHVWLDWAKKDRGAYLLLWARDNIFPDIPQGYLLWYHKDLYEAIMQEYFPGFLSLNDVGKTSWPLSAPLPPWRKRGARRKRKDEARRKRKDET